MKGANPKDFFLMTEFQSVETKNSEISLNYLTMPILVKISIGNKVKYYVNAGFGIGNLFSAKRTGDYRFIYFDTDPVLIIEGKKNDDLISDYTHFDFNLIIGSGIVFPLNSKLFLHTDLRFNRGLTEIRNGLSDTYNKAFAFAIGISYKILD